MSWNEGVLFGDHSILAGERLMEDCLLVDPLLSLSILKVVLLGSNQWGKGSWSRCRRLERSVEMVLPWSMSLVLNTVASQAPSMETEVMDRSQISQQ